MPYKDKEKRQAYLNEYKKSKRKERGLLKTGRKQYTMEEAILAEARRKEYKSQYDKEHPWKSLPIEARLLYNAKARAKKSGIAFNIEVSDISVPKVCPYLGIELELNQSRYNSRRAVASLDRIDNTKGYEKGNIEVISHLANTMKNNADPDTLKLFAKEILKRYDK